MLLSSSQLRQLSLKEAECFVQEHKGQDEKLCIHSINDESIQHLLLARHHFLWCTEMGTVYVAYSFQELVKWFMSYISTRALESKD